MLLLYSKHHMYHGVTTLYSCKTKGVATSIVAIVTLCSHSNVHWIQVEGMAYQVVYEATWVDCTITQSILVLYS